MARLWIRYVVSQTCAWRRVRLVDRCQRCRASTAAAAGANVAAGAIDADEERQPEAKNEPGAADQAGNARRDQASRQVRTVEFFSCSHYKPPNSVTGLICEGAAFRAGRIACGPLNAQIQ